MMRTLTMIVCIFCVATIISEVLGLALLWSRGQLTADTLKDIRDVVTGNTDDDFEADQEKENAVPSNDEVVRARAMGILNLNTREQELGLLKRNAVELRDAARAERVAFEKTVQGFDTQLQQLNESVVSAATEQARAVLLAMPPKDAVGSLMNIPLEKDILLVKGMPEKSIAKILQEFFKGTEEQAKRGQDIFEAISRGEPSRDLVDQSIDALTTPTATQAQTNP